MGKRRLANSTTHKTNNSTEHLVRNEENKYPVSDPNRMMEIITNEPNDS
jgi:hypothetical protein